MHPRSRAGSHPSVRARNRNRGNSLPTRNTFADWRTFREVRGRSVNVDGAIADFEVAIATSTTEPRWDKQEHRRRMNRLRVTERSSTRTIARIDEGGNGIATVCKLTSGHHRRPVSGDFGQWLRVPQSRQDVADKGGRARVRGRPRPVTRRFSISPFAFLPHELADWPRNRYARHEVLYLNRPVFKAAAADFLSGARNVATRVSVGGCTALKPRFNSSSP